MIYNIWIKKDSIDVEKVHIEIFVITENNRAQTAI